jgi:hypothetical protein
MILNPLFAPFERPDFPFVLADGGELLLPPVKVRTNHDERGSATKP